MMFPEKPQCLNLMALEDRLIHPVSLFMVYKLLLLTIITNYYIIIVVIYQERISNFSLGIAR